jgi:Terpene synthase family 2, C-terminal metal binding
MPERLAVLDISTLTFCSPVWAGAERRVRGWAERFGLVGSVDEGERLARMGQGRMAGFTAPLAAPGELDLLAQWGAMIALVDDGFDRADAPPEPAEVRRVLDALTAVLLGRSAAQDSAMPAVRAMADLWLRTAVGTSPRWCEQFAAHYQDFAEATCHEAEVRGGGRSMVLDEYLQMRRCTITVLPMLDLVERYFPLEPSLDSLRDAVADIVGWSNDLASASRERAEGRDAINLVTVLADEGSGDLAEAAATARAMISTRMDEFDDTARQVVADAGPGGTRLVDQVAVIRTFLDGALAWQAETGRNRPAETDDGQDGPAPGTPEEWHRGGYHDGLERLARRLCLAVAPTGAIADWCGSRVLESALLLALLRRTATHERHQRRLVAFLESRRADAGRIDALLIDASLNPEAMASTAGAMGEAMAADLNRGTGGRGQFKAVMLQAATCSGPCSAVAAATSASSPPWTSPPWTSAV